MNHKTYTVTVEIDVQIKNNGMVMQQPDSVSAAVRHMLRVLLATGWRKNGVMFNPATIHVEAKEKEVA